MFKEDKYKLKEHMIKVKVSVYLNISCVLIFNWKCLYVIYFNMCKIIFQIKLQKCRFETFNKFIK